jgi:hypothetical protein
MGGWELIATVMGWWWGVILSSTIPVGEGVVGGRVVVVVPTVGLEKAAGLCRGRGDEIALEPE